MIEPRPTVRGGENIEARNWVESAVMAKITQQNDAMTSITDGCVAYSEMIRSASPRKPRYSRYHRTSIIEVGVYEIEKSRLDKPFGLGYHLHGFRHRVQR